MAKKMKSGVGFLVGIACLMVLLISGGILISKLFRKNSPDADRETAVVQLEKKLKRIKVSEVAPRKATVEIDSDNLAEELPDISKYPLSVDGKGSVQIEIFSSTEKSSSGTDGWLNEVAEKFNREHHEIGGQWATISVRPVASGAAIDYIVSGKYVPEVYSPSNILWGEMLKSQNVDIHLITDRIAGNTAGILVSRETYSKLEERYGTVDISAVIQATVNSEITMGYTNPYASSTGLNFLVTALEEFDANDILSTEATAQFQKFQQNVPFVAYTTLQMREAAAKGVLDAFILEYQCFMNVSDLRNYRFIPFGVRHDNPVYTLNTLSDAQNELVQTFVEYCLSDENQRLAKTYGFNQDAVASHSKTLPANINGAALLSAQKLWKTEKDAGSPVMAVFIADVSGSMGGAPLQNLQSSLINASKYINDTNYVGLVSYSTNVAVNLPIAKFDLNQRSYFTGAVEDLSPGGNTATYDAVLVGLDMLREAQAKVESETGQQVKPLLFVLSDGETNVGNKLGDIKRIVEGMEVPCYTIGYNANLSALGELSAINEAASINADSDDVIYNLKSLFNAQM
ncbi:MAG: VWA domain-containing protein [Oscillospiraceae bacterium]|nr:VWA domain-containing protein [Oscillospiraceae bacterium]